MHLPNKFWTALVVVLALAVVAAAQGTGKTEIKQVPIKPTSASSGTEMYKTYCAVCHGVDGKGNGPAASALKVQPTDLTALAKNNGGRYPGFKVAAVIRGDSVLAAHGSKEMPIWGHLFWSVSGGSEPEARLRITNLNKYIESLQTK